MIKSISLPLVFGRPERFVQRGPDRSLSFETNSAGLLQAIRPVSLPVKLGFLPARPRFNFAMHGYVIRDAVGEIFRVARGKVPFWTEVFPVVQSLSLK
jgi:hypothetical protein